MSYDNPTDNEIQCEMEARGEDLAERRHPMTAGLPDEARVAAYEAAWTGVDDCMKDFEDDIRICGSVQLKTIRLALRLAADDALAAALPALTAATTTRAAEQERERIRQLAIEHHAIVVSMNIDKPMDIVPFADLLGDVAGNPGTPGGES